MEATMAMTTNNAGLSGPGFPMQFSSETINWRLGDPTRENPFFILVLNNIALERPWRSGYFVRDLAGPGPGSSDRTLFTNSARYIVDSLFGKLPGQAERLLSDSTHSSKIKVSSMYVWGLAPNSASALIGEEDFTGTGILVPRRNVVPAMLRHLGVNPDIVFIVSNSTINTRTSAYGTTDDDTRAGDPFVCDGRHMVHRYFHAIPGMAAIHTTSTALTAVHEFGHAFSSYTNGFVSDLYVDGDPEFNRKTGRPVPNTFAAYKGVVYAADKVRVGPGYPQDWISYHPGLIDPARPAVMDNFWYSENGITSRHDRLTKRYILDRIEAKVYRRERT
jgi:hypothetical protein